MIRLRMAAGDLESMRFAYSPLTEVAESLYLLNSGRVGGIHRPWFEMTRDALCAADMGLLRSVVPPRSYLASFLLGGATSAATTIDSQLQLVAECPPDVLAREVCAAWRGEPPPETAQRLLREGAAGARRLADELHRYWTVAIEPHWPQLRAVLDGDVAYRAARLASGGITTLLSDLHRELEFCDHAIQVAIPGHSIDKDLHGVGLLLVPCVFAWPHLIVGTASGDPPTLTYGPRGVGELWSGTSTATADDDALGALLGRSRAAIMFAVALPKSTTELARELGQSPPAVSAHLSILRRNGLVSSWRSGRRVLYQRTPLATSIVAADSSNEADIARAAADLA